MKESSRNIFCLLPKEYYPENEMEQMYRQWSPTFLAPGTDFLEDNFPPDELWGNDLGMIQVRYIYCALYFKSNAIADLTKD